MSTIPPFTRIDRHNLESVHLAIKHSIAQATFIALDTEFTGLGDQRKTRTPYSNTANPGTSRTATGLSWMSVNHMQLLRLE